LTITSILSRPATFQRDSFLHESRSEELRSGYRVLLLRGREKLWSCLPSAKESRNPRSECLSLLEVVKECTCSLRLWHNNQHNNQVTSFRRFSLFTHLVMMMHHEEQDSLKTPLIQCRLQDKPTLVSNNTNKTCHSPNLSSNCFPFWTTSFERLTNLFHHLLT
jgi:hypothetical protein